MPKTSFITVINDRFNISTPEVQDYFKHLPKLLDNFPLDISIGYLFSCIEMAQNLTLYCGVVKLHHGEITLTWQAIDNQHITRDKFRDYFKIIFGKEIDQNAISKIKNAEKTRDKIMHGKPSSYNEQKQAIIDIIDYAEAFNILVQKYSGFKPFGNLRGFKGRGISLDKSTTRWILKGMGFENIK